MKVSILDLHCLNATADDYETILSIVDDVRRSSHGNVDVGNVDVGEVAACMTDLVREGLVDLYRLDTATNEFVPLAAVPESFDGVWFRLNATGRKQLDAHWVND